MRWIRVLPLLVLVLAFAACEPPTAPIIDEEPAPTALFTLMGEDCHDHREWNHVSNECECPEYALDCLATGDDGGGGTPGSYPVPTVFTPLVFLDDGPADDTEGDDEEPCWMAMSPEKAWYCSGLPADGTLKKWIEQALDRLDLRGGDCSKLAAKGRQLLADGELRTPEGEYTTSDGLTGIGAASQRGKWIAVSADAIRRYMVAGRAEFVDRIVGHELDHAAGYRPLHVEPFGPNGEQWNTPHSGICFPVLRG